MRPIPDPPNSAIRRPAGAVPAAAPRSVILPLVSERPLTRPFAGQAVAGFQALGRFSDFGSGGRVDAFVGRHLREWTQAANSVMEDLRPYEAGQMASPTVRTAGKSVAVPNSG